MNHVAFATGQLVRFEVQIEKRAVCNMKLSTRRSLKPFLEHEFCSEYILREVRSLFGTAPFVGRRKALESLNVWYQTWLADFKIPNINPTSRNTYKQIYCCYIRPALGGMHLAKIKTLHVQKLANSLVEDELSPKYIKNIVSMFYDIMEIACDNGLIVKNPVKAVSLPKLEDIERQVLSADEQNTLFLCKT